MKNYFGIAALAAGYLLMPTAVMAAETADSATITKLLAEAKSEAADLKHDSADMEMFTKSKLSWATYAGKVDMIRDHVNNTGKLLAKLQAAEPDGSPWQRTAIQRIEPLLRELAANTEETINQLNQNRTKIHFQEFRDLTIANCDLATNLEALIAEFVSYGQSKQKMEQLKLKVKGIS